MIGPPTRLHSNNTRSPSVYPGVADDARSRDTALGSRTFAAAPVDGHARPMPAPGADGKSVVASRHEPSSSGDVSRLLSLLADKTRLKILRILAGGERPVVALTSELRLPQPTVSHHLAWLRMMDLVSPRRQGKHVFYTLGTSVDCAVDGTMTLRAADATVTITARDKA